jgi:hypothetical protein
MLLCMGEAQPVSLLLSRCCWLAAALSCCRGADPPVWLVGVQEVQERHPWNSPLVQRVYQQQCGGGGPYSAGAQRLLHTGYHKREKTVTAVLNDW